MRNLLHGDAVTMTAVERFEVLHHGHSAWRYAMGAVAGLCDRYGVDEVLAQPSAADDVEAAWAHWADTEKLTETWLRIRGGEVS